MNPHITPEYQALNAQLHMERPDYGTTGQYYYRRVRALAREVGAKTILDYGCGKATMSGHLGGYDVREYDPDIEGKEALPDPADLLVCTDVLEHIEPDLLDGVLDHFQALAKKALL